jgi:integrase
MARDVRRELDGMIERAQEWMGHRDYKTTSIYADYAPDPSRGADFAAAAFPSGDDDVTSETE